MHIFFELEAGFLDRGHKIELWKTTIFRFIIPQRKQDVRSFYPRICLQKDVWEKTLLIVHEGYAKNILNSTIHNYM